MSSPSTTSGFSVDAPTSSGNRNAGRKFANRPSSLRRRSRLAPGRFVVRDGFSSPGMPARAEQDRVGLAGELAASCGGQRIAVRRRRRPADRRLDQFERPRRCRRRLAAPSPPARVTSGPMPSPASTAIFIVCMVSFAMRRQTRAALERARSRAELASACSRSRRGLRAGNAWRTDRSSNAMHAAVGRGDRLRGQVDGDVRPGCAVELRRAARRPPSAGSTIGSKPFFERVRREDVAEARRDRPPGSRSRTSAQTACSRDEPQPKLRSATRICAPSIGRRVEQEVRRVARPRASWRRSRNR